ncbi:hypothetical protein K470DRAFT_197283, partial [Piedraia hortae CBS 480.64]
KLTDLTINCGPRSFPVHKMVMGAQSNYFLALENFSEGKSNVVNLKAADPDDRLADDPDAVGLMIDFAYHQHYKVESIPSSAVEKQVNGNLLMHAKVFATAVKYQFDSLKEAAVNYFGLAIQSDREGESLADVIRFVYTSTAEEEMELREIISNTLLIQAYLLNRPDIEAAVKATPDLAFGLV